MTPKLMFLQHVRRVLKDLAFRTPAARLLTPRYHYNFYPAQLAYLVSALDEIGHVGGSVVEVGCFAGATTIFLCEHLANVGQRRRYIAIDTFKGFLRKDVDHEVRAREKGAQRETFATVFTMNRRSWVERSLAINGHADVEVIEADAGALDYRQFAPIAFALIDVDLYQPVSRALRAIAPWMSGGGIIVVDDCRPGNLFDGALEAYTEWCAKAEHQPEIVRDRLGVIRF